MTGSKIVDARVIVSCPARNFVTLKITTADGLYGIGDGTLNGRELSVASYLQDHVVPCLMGRDSERIEDTWQFLYRGAYWRRGPVTMSAIAAVDVALWDLKAKRAGMPLYQLLGGRSREGALVYAHANGHSIEDLLASVAKHLELGYKAIRVQAAVPGVPDAYGVPHGIKPYEPADSDLPREETWSTQRYLRFVPQLMDAVRARFGFDLTLLHDAHHRLPRLKLPRWARASNHTACSGWKMRRPRKIRTPFVSSGSTPPRRSRWAKCSTPSSIASNSSLSS